MDRALAADVQADPLTSGIRHDLADLEASLGYTFADRFRLVLALTHIGAAASRPKSYQRLEFLGDRVLGLAVSAMLYATFPEADEGDLSRRLADLVRRESCAEVAADWGVEPHIRLAAGERASAALRRAILGDVCEAILGAVYLDGGLPAAQALVERAFAERMRTPRRLRDAKTTLQEWAQAKGLAVPLYREVGRRGVRSTRRNSRSPSRSTASPMPRPRVPRSASPSRRPPKPSWRARGSCSPRLAHERGRDRHPARDDAHPMRLRRADRRAQRRQYRR